MHKNKNKMKEELQTQIINIITIRRCRDWFKSPKFIKSLDIHSMGYILLY